MTKLKQYLKNSAKAGLLLFSSLALLSCVLQKPSYGDKALETKIIKSLKEQRINAAIKTAENTFYIYAPTEKEIVMLERVSPNPEKKETLSVMSAGSEYDGDSFTIFYAAKTLPPTKTFVENITYNFTHHANRVINQIFFIFQESLKNPKIDFDFYVIVLADISRGIEVKYTINGDDFKNYAQEILPPFEFYKRLIIEINGEKKIVGDKNGNNVEYKNIKNTDFINDLFSYKVRSGIEPGEDKDTGRAVLKVFYKIIGDYKFEDFTYIKLRDLLKEEDRLFSYQELKIMFADDETL